MQNKNKYDNIVEVYKKGGMAVRNFVYKPIDFLAIFILFYKDFMFDFNNLFNNFFKNLYFINKRNDYCRY